MLGANIRTELYSNLRNCPLECAGTGTGENLFEQSSLFVGSILNTSRHLCISSSWIVGRLSKLIRGNKGIKQKKKWVILPLFSLYYFLSFPKAAIEKESFFYLFSFDSCKFFVNLTRDSNKQNCEHAKQFDYSTCQEIRVGGWNGSSAEILAGSSGCRHGIHRRVCYTFRDLNILATISLAINMMSDFLNYYYLLEALGLALPSVWLWMGLMLLSVAGSRKMSILLLKSWKRRAFPFRAWCVTSARKKIVKGWLEILWQNSADSIF